jgi:hypothetical protein
MLHATREVKPKRKTRKVQFPGITEDARRLGVNRTTLWRTLNGDWHLPGLRNRYHQLKDRNETR